MTSGDVNNAAYSSRKAASEHVKRAGLHRLVDSVSTMCEEGLGFGPRQRRATVGNGVIKGGFCPRANLAQMGFELGEELLDRVEVRRVGGGE